MELYTLFCNKEFMDKKTYIILQLTLGVWAVFVTFQSVVSKLVDKTTPKEERRSALLVAYLGITTGIIKSMMEVIKNNFHMWLA